MSQPDEKQKSNNKARVGGAIGGVAAVAIIIALFVPLIPVSYEETYQTTHTKTISYQEMESRNNVLFSIDDQTLDPGVQYSPSAWVEAGHNIEFMVNAQQLVQTAILSSDGQVLASREGENIRYGITTPIDDHYIFTIYNPHTGFFDIGGSSVGIYEASATEEWNELVTKQRDMTEPVTEQRTIRKNVTLLEVIMTQNG